MIAPALQAINIGTRLNPINFLKKDGRHFQLLYLGSFLVYGILALGWGADIINFVAIFAACITTQLIAVRLTTRDYRSIKSALITSLALCLLCKANSPWTLAMAGSLAIAGKFLIRYNNKHLFNPANFGIIMAILITGDAWVSPGQWGSNVILLFLLGAAGSIVLLRVGRLDTTLAFLVTFGLLQFVRNVLYLGWPVDYFFHQMTSGAILLFAFFMITDPKTTPNAPKARIIWAALIGIIAFVMTNWFFVHTAPIWALFFIIPLTVVLDKYFKAKRFSWYA